MSVGEDVEKREPTCLKCHTYKFPSGTIMLSYNLLSSLIIFTPWAWFMEMWIGPAITKKRTEVLQKTENRNSYDIVIPLLSIYPKVMKPPSQRNMSRPR